VQACTRDKEILLRAEKLDSFERSFDSFGWRLNSLRMTFTKEFGLCGNFCSE
jgi:hypothetical protein